MCTLNIKRIRADFPVLQSDVIYFDNACMTLRPKQVIDAMDWYYNKNCACAERSLHRLGAELTDKVENARENIKKFFGADNSYELIFTKNTTEAINLVAHGFCFKEKDEVIISDREHNSNLVPWLALREKGLICNHVPSMQSFEFDLDKFSSLLSRRTRLVSVVHVSNIDGYKMPAKEIIKIAHENKTPVLLDAAQSAGHIKMNVKKLDVDFAAVSAHKMCGPIIGCLIAKKEMIAKIKPLVYGGGTVESTTLSSYKLTKSPEAFEAGLQNYAAILGFEEACNYLKKIGMEKIEKYEDELNKVITKGLFKIEGLYFIGVKDARKRIAIASFGLQNIDASDVAIMLDELHAIAVRAGKHCAHSWFNAHKMPSSVRASLYFYNTKEEVGIFVEELEKIAKLIKNKKGLAKQCA